MKRQTTSFVIDSPEAFKQQALKWADRNYNTVLYCDNNGYKDYPYSTYEGLIAAGAKDSITLTHGNAFEQLKAFYERQKDWLFGFLGYDLKNEVEKLSSDNPDGLKFPDLFFFRPEWVIEIHKRHAVVHGHGNFRTLLQQEQEEKQPAERQSEFELHPRISRTEYLQTVEKIHKHIAKGDIYEMNLCQEFYAEGAEIDPLTVFNELNALSKAPFSCFLKHDGEYLLSASPERFLKKEGDKLVSMPVKGTARRGRNFEEDTLLRDKLFNDQKERSENVMIVDLVRNDLSRSCVAGTVQVEELFGIKTFEQVHQMVSTISGTLRNDTHFTDAIKNAFPMGSMTGAPKVRAMELIEQYEKSKRGLYSGAVGYITPEGDFDFNVVIRSLLYNSLSQYLSFHVGGAITFGSVPEREYEECLLKAGALREVVGQGVESRKEGRVAV